MGASGLERGARFELRLESSGEGSATYRGRVTLPGGHVVDHRLVCAAAVTAVPDSGVLPAWADEWLLTLARRTARSAVTTGRWPRRITEWRDQPDG